MAKQSNAKKTMNSHLLMCQDKTYEIETSP